jgi:response regulator RpfG family c-di-GMP phosphodiesterase
MKDNTSNTDKILFVDDDENILKSYKRTLRRHHAIDTAESGDAGLEAVRRNGPYAVVVADMRMPGMNGVEFLRAVKDIQADTVRIMLTGNADQATAVDAVNQGCVFRFLNKPCSPEDLLLTLAAGLEQYRLITAERVLLQKTLGGSISVLNEVLALTSPIAFGQATRVHDLVAKLCAQLNVERSWECVIAAMLSQIGCVTLPPDTIERAYGNAPLTSEDMEMLSALPRIGAGLVGKIPRLERVARIIAYQQKGFDGSGVPEDGVVGKDILLGARILKLALDYDSAKWRHNDRDALKRIEQHSARYDPDVVRALKAIVVIEAELARCEITLEELRPGMLLAADVKTSDDMTVVSSGQVVSDSLYERICNFGRQRTIAQPIIVLLSEEEAKRRESNTPTPVLWQS